MTRSFVFGLEPVRRLRQRAEERAQEELATSLRAHRESVEALAAANEELASARRDQPLLAGTRVLAGDDLRAAQAYVERMDLQRRTAAAQLAHQDGDVQLRRDALGVAARDRTVLDRLRDRREEEHRLEAERRQAVALDEIAIVAHRRKGAA